MSQNTTAITNYRNLGEIKAQNISFFLLNKLQRIPDEIDIGQKAGKLKCSRKQ